MNELDPVEVIPLQSLQGLAVTCSVFGGHQGHRGQLPSACRSIARGEQHRLRTKAEEWVAIFGAGGVGLSAVMIGASVGARVIAVERNPDALSLAKRVGALDAVDVSPSVAEQIFEITDGERTSPLTPWVPRQPVLQRSGRCAAADDLADRAVVGRSASSRAVGQVIGWELDILGSHGMAARDYADMLDLVRNGSCGCRKSSDAS